MRRLCGNTCFKMIIKALADSMEKINTHNVIVTFGKHKGELWTRVPKNYLTWLVNEKDQKFPGTDINKQYAQAELERRGTKVSHQIELSAHAIDRASQVTNEWRSEGVYTWLERMATEALETSDDDEVFYKGYKFAFKKGEYYPSLLTIIKK